jgi:hypothetical protein
MGKPFLLSEKKLLLSEFFPAKIFFCSERFPFSKIPEKILAGKKLTEQINFFAEQKRLVHFKLAKQKSPSIGQLITLGWLILNSINFPHIQSDPS